MPVKVPKRRPAFPPLNRLRSGPFSGGKRGLMLALNLTAMVDMFTVIVIFLLQNFSASGEILFMQKDLKLPDAEQSITLSERGPVVTLFDNEVLWEGERIGSLGELNDKEPGIPELTKRLEAVKKREEELKARSGAAAKPEDAGKPFDGHIIVQADVSTDFKLVRNAIFSVNKAGWVHIQFATMPLAKAPALDGTAH